MSFRPLGLWAFCLLLIFSLGSAPAAASCEIGARVPLGNERFDVAVTYRRSTASSVRGTVSR